MRTVCPQCGGLLSSTDALCPECLKRVALRETAEFDEAKATGVNDLLPESTQQRTVRTSILPAGGAMGERWGDYALLELIGRGAMGEVFKARHVRLNRLVALKLIRHGTRATESERKRFLREAEAVARLQHPHIVMLYETGEAEGQPYLAMEYVPGKTLAESIAEKPLPPRPAAECMKKISVAVHYAHEHGVLHRDLKPSNVMLDQNAEPRVMDFGLARLTEQDSEMTLSGMAIGSPSYMSPEQAAGKVQAVSAASDVYSLGAILYETLTARPPFQAESSAETMRQVIEIDPVSPRLLNASVPRDLETICLKCLEKDQQRRYHSAQELADELGRFLRDEPIRARPLRAPARLLRWCRRRPAVALSLATATALLLIVAVGSPIAVFRINEARKQEAGLRHRAEAAEQRTEQQLYAALLEQARASVLTGEVGHRVRALDAVRQAAAISNSAALRGVAVAALALPDLRFEREWPASTTLAVLDPTFERVALGDGGGPVEIRSAAEGRLLATLPASTNLTAFVGSWSADGGFFAVSRDCDATASERDVEVWEVATARQVLLRRNMPWGAMSFHPQLHRLIFAENDAAVIWDLETGRELTRYSLRGKPVVLKFAPDGKYFASLLPEGQEWVVTVHDAADGSVHARHRFTSRVRELDWHPDARVLAVPDFSGAVHLMDAHSGDTRVLGWHKSTAVRTFFAPGGDYLFSSGWDRQLICWDLKAMRRAFAVGLHSYVMQFRSDGNQCAMLVRPEMRLQLYAFERPNLSREFAEDLGGARNSAAFSPDGRWLAGAGGERLVVWDLTSDAPGAVIDGAGGSRVGFAPNGELFADSPDACLRFRTHANETNGAAPTLEPLNVFRPDGFVSVCPFTNGVILTGNRGSRLVGYDQLAADSGHWKPTAPGLNGVSPDGRWLGMYLSYSPYFLAYRLPEFEPVASLTNEGSIGQFEFSPKSDEVAISRRGGVEFWSTTTWQRLRCLTDYSSILYSPDAEAFWLSTDWRTAGLYDARTVEPILPLPRNSFPLAVSRDGLQLAVSVDLRRMQVWNLGEMRRQLRQLGLDWHGPSTATQTSGQ
jgi:eukaryotic-like serine/threonine-protein kinase